MLPEKNMLAEIVSKDLSLGPRSKADVGGEDGGRLDSDQRGCGARCLIRRILPELPQAARAVGGIVGELSSPSVRTS